MNGKYLSHQYDADIAKVEYLRSLTDKGLESLIRAQDNERGTWPYSLQEGKAVEVPESFSIVTNAMTVHAIAVCFGSIRDSVLVPGLRLRPEYEKPLLASSSKVQEFGTRMLIEELKKQRSRALLTESKTWGKNDPLTLTWLHEILETEFAKSIPGADALDKKLKAIAKDAITTGFDDPDDFLFATSGEMGVTANPFRLLRLVHLAHSIKLLPNSIDNRETVSTVNLERYLKNVLHTQLSKSAIRNGGFDPSVLTFALEALMLINLESVSDALVDRVIEVLSSDRSRSTHWRPVRPIHVTKEGSVLLPQSIEVANSYLRIGSLHDSVGTDPLFSRSREMLDSFEDWVTSSVIKVSVCPDLGEEGPGSVFRGWKSEHTHSQGRIDLWATSQVLLFLEHFGSMLEDHVAWSSRINAGLEFFPAQRPSGQKVEDLRTREWAETLNHEPMLLHPQGSRYRSFETVGERFVNPRISNGPTSPAYSMLLYGPPGTGKTSFARSLARAVGYDFINVTPSDFLRAGESGVEATAQELFKVLMAQSDAVILFDEIDRLLLDRESPEYGSQSDMFQFMTPSMLTKFNDLRRKQRCIFIVATNYAWRIDNAIRRPGRIDHQLLFLPPNYEQRRVITEAAISDSFHHDSRGEIVRVIASRTPLYVYREIVELVGGLERENSLEKSDGEFRKDLEEFLRMSPPKITLNQYKKHMCEKVKEFYDPAVGAKTYGGEPRSDLEKVPWEEFGLLTYLTLECKIHPVKSPPEPDPEAWIKNAIVLALDRFEPAIYNVLADFCCPSKNI